MAIFTNGASKLKYLSQELTFSSESKGHALNSGITWYLTVPAACKNVPPIPTGTEKASASPFLIQVTMDPSVPVLVFAVTFRTFEDGLPSVKKRFPSRVKSAELRSSSYLRSKLLESSAGSILEQCVKFLRSFSPPRVLIFGINSTVIWLKTEELYDIKF